MKPFIVFAIAVMLALTCSAQTTRQAIGRLERQGVVTMKPLPPKTYSPAAPTAPATAPANAPAAAAASAIEPDLKASPISLFGKVNGLSGTLYVTNVGAKAVSPFVQLAVV